MATILVIENTETHRTLYAQELQRGGRTVLKPECCERSREVSGRRSSSPPTKSLGGALSWRYFDGAMEATW